MESWESFFLGQLGASAALGGLLFVAVSLNVTQISAVGGLADRALLALSLLLAVLVASSVMLIPGQPDFVVGIEVLVVGIGLAMLVAAKRARSFGQAGPPDRAKSLVSATLLAIAIVPYFAGGAMIAAGKPSAGLYFVAAAIIFSFVKAVLDAWVLLVEINR
jgi:hypothetical protein